MAKVNNPCFLADAGEYLEENGYKRSEGAFFSKTIFYYKDSRGVAISGDSADFVTYGPEDPERIMPGFNRYMALTGISHLNLFNWMLAFHITDIVPMQHFLKSVQEQAPQVDLIADLFSHFNQVHHKPIPVSY